MFFFKPSVEFLVLLFLAGTAVAIAGATPMYWSGLVVLATWAYAIKQGMILVIMFILLALMVNRLL